MKLNKERKFMSRDADIVNKYRKIFQDLIRWKIKWKERSRTKIEINTKKNWRNEIEFKCI